MRESTTYQGILDEGRREGRREGWVLGRRESILDLASLPLGPPPAAVADRLAAVDDLDRLRRMLRRASTASDWDDLLGTP